MTSNDPRLRIPEYLSDRLSAEERTEFESAMVRDPALRDETDELRSVWNGLSLLPQPEPSAALRAQFYQKLQMANRPAVKEARSFWNRWTGWQQLAAAAALFLIGLFFGQIHRSRSNQAEELAAMRTQVQSLREMVALSLLDRQSAASRLQGVSWTNRVDRPDNELLSALLSALNGDPNVNVRLSSVDALERYGQDASIRKALLNSLPRQDSPLVQIALIDSLVHMRENTATEEFKRLSQNAQLNSAVRQRARWALIRLEEPNPANK